MEPEWDGDFELHECGYWGVGLCTGVDGRLSVDELTVWVVVGVLAVVVATVVV